MSKMKLALVEDEEVQIKYLWSLINEISKEIKEPISLTTFTSSKSFLFSYEDANYDGVLLDIKMEGIDGFSLAKQIRSTNNQVLLAFLTGEAEYVYEGYEVNACGYLLKPVKKEALTKLLMRMKEQLHTSQRKLTIKTKDGVQTILEDDIIYLESQNHNVKLQTQREVLIFSGKISEYEHKLDTNSFFQPHRSYFIHIGHVKRVTKKECVMTNDVVIPIARGKYETLMKQYLAYHRAME